MSERIEIDLARCAEQPGRVYALRLAELIEEKRAKLLGVPVGPVRVEVSDSRRHGAIVLQGHFVSEGVSLFFGESLTATHSICIGGGDLDVRGTIYAGDIIARSVRADGHIRASGITAETGVGAGGNIIMPMESTIFITGEYGELRARSIDVGSIVAANVFASMRIAAHGGVVQAQVLNTPGRLHIGRGREGNVRGVLLRSLAAGSIDSDASIIVEGNAEFGGETLISGDLVVQGAITIVAESRHMDDPENDAGSAVRHALVLGSLATPEITSDVRVVVGCDPRVTTGGRPRIMVSRARLPGAGEIIRPAGQAVELYDLTAARMILSRTKFPVMDVVGEQLAERAAVRADPVAHADVSAAPNQSNNHLIFPVSSL